MPLTIRRCDYFYAMIKDRPGEGYRLLSRLADEGIDLLAFNAVPMGGENTQLVLFPVVTAAFMAGAERAGLCLAGPQRAFLIQGDDRLGAFADIHHRLADARINVFSANGVTDGRGGFGYIIHVRPEDFENAARVLEEMTR